MLLSLAGRVAVVTGAGSGLGKAYAHALAAAGAQVIVADRDLTSAEETTESIEVQGYLARPLQVDVANEASIASFAQRLESDFEYLHVLVNNAGVTSLPARAHEVTVADFDRVMAINVRGMFLCTRALIPHMLRAGSASLINISSIIGLVGVYPGFEVSGVPYATSKAAVVGFTRQVAVEYARDGLRANVIAPGWHGGTNLGRERRGVATREELQRFETYIRESVPMGRRGLPSEMDGLIVYLASDASRYVTGQVFAHDGGVTAG